MLEQIISSIHDVAIRQLKDQLIGGKHDSPDESLKFQAQSCVSNNISGERIFGMLDGAMKRAPNANCDYNESKIIFSVNDTSSWLEGKCVEERGELIRIVRKEHVILWLRQLNMS